MTCFFKEHVKIVEKYMVKFNITNFYKAKKSGFQK